MIQASPFVPPKPEELAPFFPSYAIQSLIACGGMGAVYHARQTALERDVAIKILPREFSGDTDFRANFAAEAKAMAKLNHPNLIGVYDFGEANGMLFIIMEYVPGQSLYQRTAGMAVNVQEASELMARVCAGLGHAHHHGILHRDIKPANILLDLQGNPKIGDFGLARPIGLKARSDEVIYGTPHYTAPEVIANPGAVNAQADIFSLGVVLHELLTGKLPAADKRTPSAISGCPTAFDAIVQRAMNPNPAMRYPDATSMERDLAKLAQAFANPASRIVAKPGGAGRAVPQVVRLPHGSRRAPARPKTRGQEKSGAAGKIALWVLLAIGLVGAGWYVYQRSESTRASDPSTQTPQDQPGQATGTTTGIPGKPAADVIVNPDEPYDPGSFDVKTFIGHAQDVIRRKAGSAVSARDAALKLNLENYVARISRQARDITDPDLRLNVNTLILAKTAEWRVAGNRLPPPSASGLGIVPGERETLDTFLTEQNKIDSVFQKKLNELKDIYIKGIEMQIGRMDPKEQPWQIARLKSELDTTRSTTGHIREIVGE